ncbi:MAG: radical SAM protein [Archangium gephyra]|uniref:Radical SAM protein n=1 Tax=Archangium gephyra TaxID=48 RepID=A0A2W5U167_9BACT|nr:MAG: radical SAM protein [Archangium gephyra]
MAPYKLLLADPRGRVVEHPWLLASLRSDESILPPVGRPIPLPVNAKLAHLPGRLPVGIDPNSGEPVLVKEFELDGKRFTPHAVGAVLPPGFTRTYLPGEVKADGPVLPQWAYTAAAWGKSGPVVWAVHTDRRKHWTPDRFSTPEVKALVKAHMARFPDNQVLKQLKTCALVYRCFTSQNVFYARDEAAIPASIMCNAKCVGCISEQPEDGPPASHERMDHGPTPQEMADIAVFHLEHAPGRTMVSYGQGCEGEPLTRWKAIADSIRIIRSKTQRGSININTNGSLTRGLSALYDAGLDSVRVSLNSAVKDLYEAYYQPHKYGWEDVEASIALSRDRGAYIALNLLLFPGVTDRQGEAEALLKLVKKYRVDQIQTRPLAIDPVQYIDVARGKGAGGEPMGVAPMLAWFKKHAPWLVIGNFARGLGERRQQPA